MSILRFIFELFLIYLAYKLVFGFIIPVYNASKKMKGQMHEMQEKMRQQQQNQQQASQPPVEQQEEKVSKKDYIDFEEIKN